MILRPFPRLFPDVATVVGGVVAEAGPLQLGGLPDRIGLLTSASELPLEELAVPAAPHITSVNGAPLAAGAKVDGHDGLTIGVSGDAGTIVELRPFGATVAISCAVPPSAAGESTLTVPRALVARLTGAANSVSDRARPRRCRRRWTRSAARACAWRRSRRPTTFRSRCGRRRRWSSRP